MLRSEFFGASRRVQIHNLFFSQLRRKVFISTGLTVCVYGALLLMSPGVEAQTPPSPQTAALNQYGEAFGGTVTLHLDVANALKDKKCLDRKTIDLFIDRAQELLADTSLLQNNPALPEYLDSPHAEPERTSKKLDEQRSSLNKLVRELPKKICPPEPEPVKLYHVGFHYEPPPQERVEIGESGRPWTRPYFGIETLENFGRVRTTETLAATGQTTFQSTDSGDPLGVGLVAGYNFQPWNNKIIVGPYASFDWLNQTINHAFAGGQFYGTTTHWIATVGAKGGYAVTPGVFLYGLAGVSWLNQSLNVNFATTASSNATTPGFTLGLGGEYQPSSWRLLGNSVSVFMQYQHTWWGTANFNTPTSSPAFNYAFKREDDTLKLGVNIHLSR